MKKKIVLHVGCDRLFLDCDLFNKDDWQEIRLDIDPVVILWEHRDSIKRGNHYMAHKTGFTIKTLEKNLARVNFQKIKIKSVGWDLWATAYKVSADGQS